MITIYTPQESTGNLKYIADVEDETDPTLALDAVLDEMPRLKDTTFYALVSENGDGTGSLVLLEVGDEPPARRPKRQIKLLGNAGSNGAAVVDEEEEVEEDEAPAPKRRTATKRAPAKKAPAKKTATKTTTTTKKTLSKKPAGTTKPAARRTGGKKPYTRSAKGDE